MTGDDLVVRRPMLGSFPVEIPILTVRCGIVTTDPATPRPDDPRAAAEAYRKSPT